MISLVEHTVYVVPGYPMVLVGGPPNNVRAPADALPDMYGRWYGEGLYTSTRENMWGLLGDRPPSTIGGLPAWLGR